MIDDSNFHVYLVPFPGDVKALVSLGADDFYSIFVNSNLSYESQIKAVKHEIRHILRDDFYNELPIKEIESD